MLGELPELDPILTGYLYYLGIYSHDCSRTIRPIKQVTDEHLGAAALGSEQITPLPVLEVVAERLQPSRQLPRRANIAALADLLSQPDRCGNDGGTHLGNRDCLGIGKC